MEPKKRHKTGGRQKGTPNHTTKSLRQWVNNFVINQTDKIEADWLLLEPKDRIVAFQQLLKYSLPTLQAVSVTSDLEKQLEILTDEQLEDLMNKILETQKTHQLT